MKKFILLMLLGITLSSNCNVFEDITNKFENDAQFRSRIFGCVYSLVSNNAVFNNPNHQSLLLNAARIVMWGNILFPYEEGQFTRGINTWGAYSLTNFAQSLHR